MTAGGPLSGGRNTRNKTALKSGPKATSATSTPPSDHDFAAVGAFLEERDLMLEVFRDCLDLMAYAEDYWKCSHDNAPNSAPMMMSRAQLFMRLHDIHKKNLRRRILESKERLDKAEHRYMKALKIDEDKR